MGGCRNLTKILVEYKVTITALQEIKWLNAEQISIGNL